MRTTPKLTDEPNEYGSFEIRWSELRGGVWRSCKRSTKTGDIEEARIRLARFLLDQKAEAEGEKHPVSAILDAYLESHCKPLGLLASTRHVLRAPRLAFGDRDPLSITQADVDGYVKDRCRGKYGDRKLRPQSAARELAGLQAALNWGSEQRMVPGKPTFKFRRPPSGPRRDLWLTEEQERDIKAKLRLATPRVRLFTLMGLTYAVRRGAMLDLRFGPQVSFISNSIDFNVPGARRSRKRRAVVPMTPEIRAELEALFQPGERVFHATVDKDFAGFMDEIGYGWVTPHTLKHTAITLLLRSGQGKGDPMWPMKVAEATQTSLATIMAVYWHHAVEDNLSIFQSRRA